MDTMYYCLDPYLNSSADAVLTGTLEHAETKASTTKLFLQNTSIQLKNTSKTFSFSDFLILADNTLNSRYPSGCKLQICGSIFSLSVPSGPGQFDEKNYYKEKNIYYKMTAKSIHLITPATMHPKQYLYALRDKIIKVYTSCLKEKEAGILSAMLLGEKSLLDADIKSLYQINGMGHILAISGLHITILCTLVYQLGFCLWLPRPFPFLITILFLAAYGIMTGFGISTSRAVIMMFLALLAKEIGRGYDAPTAMSVSALCILLQKPYALFSCSFLLSYGAMAGVYLIYPTLKSLIFRTMSEEKARRKKSIKHLFLEKITSSLLLSISIWFATLPVLLYFFYEIPTYGILLNLFVLPLIPVLVTLAMLGGITGLFFLPLADQILSVASIILAFYEKLCKLILMLPQPVQVLGRPSLPQILFYYLLLFSLYLISRLLKKKRILRFLSLSLLMAAITILVYRAPVNGLKITMLDVGQGDCILIQTEQRKNILIDGGSTSISNAGRYRILPHLKYYGIRKIDYLLMTHSDEDHISGQKELIKDCTLNGISIGVYLIPELPNKLQDSNYREMKHLAVQNRIPICYINKGDSLSCGPLEILCLHPEKDFSGGSANSCSVTLSLTYGEFSMLLTGDLEEEGEEAVIKEFNAKKYAVTGQQTASNSHEGKFPLHYTVLKVAHHGSRNSTTEAFLSQVHPLISLISCGAGNRYGHPHAELLERLQSCHSAIYQTDRHGVIWISTDGRQVYINTFL